ncbi:hypothetical protein [Archangium violaceum]|uniref:Uncharacterized protein n=1 Tax=Archangium violaceum Cb vi76 TaxID=1406225 RepID=A0A084SFU2_9BACT|nr:hypothetical protein [Archangium violaceum]KFA87327.1 hypothetical protein Q664_48695 [Archangium violaceum Cb vi76]
MTLSEAKQAGIVMYGDASFSIDAYAVEHFQGFAHFVAAVIVDEAHGVRPRHGVELVEVVYLTEGCSREHWRIP